MYVCMYVCMYVHVCVCMYVRMYVSIVCVCTYLNEHADDSIDMPPPTGGVSVRRKASLITNIVIIRWL